MGKSLNIKDPEAYRLVRDLAQRTGRSLTRTVVEALRERIERMEDASRSADLEAEMEAVARRICALPVLDTRSADEILGYNEKGLFD